MKKKMENLPEGMIPDRDNIVYYDTEKEKINFCTYTKKEFMSMMEKTINDNDVVILTTAVKTVETKPKLKLSFLSFQFPHEMLNEPDDIRGLVVGNVVSSIIVARNPKETISKEYMKQLKKNDGVYGFTIEQ